MKAGVIGSPIAHSLSPLIFKFVAHRLGQNIDYQAYEVKLEESKKFFQELKIDNSFVGLNITLPFKESFLNDLNKISPEVKALGALNVLHIKGDEIHGFNTDVIGIQKTFESRKFLIDSKKCFLFGAGGSAKAVAYVLGKEGAFQVTIFNRSIRGQEIVNQFSLLFPKTKWNWISSFNELPPEKISYDLVINATPLGMTGKDSGVEFFHSLEKIPFSQNALAFDLIYTPEETDFLKSAKALGLSGIGGIGMLIDQALASWKIWFGELINEHALHQELEAILKGVLKLRQNQKSIYLTGFMGVGKSKVGLELAHLLGRTFLDTDQLIEAKAKSSIKDIFSNFGESYFRDIENSILLETLTFKNSIIALGGGALIKVENQHVINQSGLLIYLSASENILFERIEKQNLDRPILLNLAVDEKKQKIKELLMLRLSVYQKAKIHVQTDLLNAQDVVFKILAAIGENEIQESK
ncbi:MAG: shikimate dehydrogenase [Bacteriovorax sp.]|nr:shikimate dehydrogenase [Bacteriovorax sp.]